MRLVTNFPSGYDHFLNKYTCFLGRFVIRLIFLVVLKMHQEERFEDGGKCPQCNLTYRGYSSSLLHKCHTECNPKYMWTNFMLNLQDFSVIRHCSIVQVSYVTSKAFPFYIWFLIRCVEKEDFNWKCIKGVTHLIGI